MKTYSVTLTYTITAAVEASGQASAEKKAQKLAEAMTVQPSNVPDWASDVEVQFEDAEVDCEE